MTLQRKISRKYIDTDAVAYVARPTLSRSLVKLRDISPAGLSFQWSAPLEPGAAVVMTFCVPGTARPCTVQGTVVYACAQGSHFRIGLRLEPDYRRVLST